MFCFNGIPFATVKNILSLRFDAIYILFSIRCIEGCAVCRITMSIALPTTVEWFSAIVVGVFVVSVVVVVMAFLYSHFTKSQFYSVQCSIFRHLFLDEMAQKTTNHWMLPRAIIYVNAHKILN